MHNVFNLKSYNTKSSQLLGNNPANQLFAKAFTCCLPQCKSIIKVVSWFSSFDYVNFLFALNTCKAACHASIGSSYFRLNCRFSHDVTKIQRDVTKIQTIDPPDILLQ